VEGSCEHGNEPSGSVECWEILEWLHNWRSASQEGLSSMNVLTIVRHLYEYMSHNLKMR
jgi:hypothetical protein